MPAAETLLVDRIDQTMPQWKRWVLTGLIVTYLGVIVCCLLPDSYIHDRTEPLIQRSLVPLGLWQWWGVFAPDPSNLNLYIYAIVRHPDGTSNRFDLPAPSQVSPVFRSGFSRWHSFVEVIHNDDHAMFWPDLAKWIGREEEKKTGKLSVRVRLWREWWWVPPWEPGMHDPPAAHWSKYLFYDSSDPSAGPQVPK